MPTINRGKLTSTLARICFHLVCWLPLAWILYAYFSGRLSVNPIQDIEQQLGHFALYFLFATLTCTPLHTLFGWRQPLKYRRALGLYCFLYASLHVLAFSGLDYGFNLRLIGGIVIKKPYAILGLLAFVLLLPLAVTSSRVEAETRKPVDKNPPPGLRCRDPCCPPLYLGQERGPFLNERGYSETPGLGIVVTDPPGLAPATDSTLGGRSTAKVCVPA